MNRWLMAIAALAVGGFGYAVLGAAPARRFTVSPGPEIDFSGLPAAVVLSDAAQGEITIELPPVDVSSDHHASQPPVAVAELPVTGSIFGFRTEVVDSAGRLLPAELIHHFNILDPTARELFLPIARRLAASGRETGVVRLPKLLVGAPVQTGQRVVASAMLHNPTGAVYRGVRVRMILTYVPAKRPWPLFAASPWQLDVAFPVGDKTFDLPPGRSERAYEGSPAIPGDLVVIGGHLHEYGVRIELWDMTEGTLIWRGEPKRQGDAIPIGKLYGLTRLGAHITPAHRYRVQVFYDNPTGRTIPNGGMGVVAGLFVPDRGTVWPSVNPADSLYRADLRHYLRVETLAPPHTHVHP